MDRNISSVERDILLEKYRDVLVDSWDWSEERVAEWRATLKDRGIYNPRINFSGFWSQGDGASFTGSVDNPEKFLQDHFPDQTKYLQWAARRGCVSISLSRDHVCRYYHERSVVVVCEFDYYPDVYESGPDPLEIATAEVYLKLAREELNNLQSSIEDLFVSWMREIYKSLEDEYEDLTSDEAVWDWILHNVGQEEINGVLGEEALSDET
jgi:hypothetical protein